MADEKIVTLEEQMFASQRCKSLTQELRDERAKPLNEQNFPQLIEYVQELMFWTNVETAYFKQENKYYIPTPSEIKI